MAKPDPKAPARRTVARVERETRVFIGPAFTRLAGGTWVTDPAHVEALRGCDGVTLHEGSDEELAKLVGDHDAKLEALRKDAAALGFVLVPHGDHLPRD
jgi:hypothetical protein